MAATVALADDRKPIGPTVYAMELEAKRARDAVPTLFDEPEPEPKR